MIFQDLLGYSTLRTAEFEETNRKSLVNGSFTRLFRCSRRMPDSSSAKFRMPEANAIGPGKRTKRRLRASIPANRIRRPIPRLLHQTDEAGVADIGTVAGSPVAYQKRIRPEMVEIVCRNIDVPRGGSVRLPVAPVESPRNWCRWYGKADDNVHRKRYRVRCGRRNAIRRTFHSPGRNASGDRIRTRPPGRRYWPRRRPN